MISDTVLSYWDFERESTHSYTNAFHKYPAMLVPKVVEELLKEYSTPNGIFFDPFCGTARSLVAAMIQGMKCFGIDINPLAVLISNVKLFTINPDYLKMKLAVILHQFDECACFSADPVRIPSFYNRAYWFSERSSLEIALLIEAINLVFQQNCRAKDFFYVCLSETIRDVSWTRKSEFKLYRIDHNKMQTYSPDTISLFATKTRRNIEGMSAFKAVLQNLAIKFSILKGDAREITTNSKLIRAIPKEVNLIITSPPYGDSRTTVDYGNFSRLSLQWLQTDFNFAKRWGFSNNEDIVGINRDCLGGKVADHLIDLPSPTLKNILERIKIYDPKRSEVVQAFYSDFYLCYKGLSHVLSKCGHLCFVVANRTVKGIEIPMNKIIAELGNSLGFKHVRSISRRIIGKKLPRRINTNSHNLTHINTMLQEHIEIFKKA